MNDLSPMTAEQAIEGLRTVVTEFGRDHVYSRPEGAVMCQYVHWNTSEQGPLMEPGCLVAQVLHRHGISLDDLSKAEGLGAYQLKYRGDLVRRGVENPTPWVTSEAARILDAAQSIQDTGGTWGWALEAALAAGVR